MTASYTPIFTIGHSSRSLEDFLALLAESEIKCLVDVRRLPGSRKFPHFDADELEVSLQGAGISYWRMDALCGRRTAQEVVGLPVDRFWTNASFARYAAWTHSDAFSGALDALLEQARRERCVLMCAEAVWWRCHRRIIADHLLARGCDVRHIMQAHKVIAATLTSAVQVHEGQIVYVPQNP